jgi:hypothetical protein
VTESVGQGPVGAPGDRVGRLAYRFVFWTGTETLSERGVHERTIVTEHGSHTTWL